MSDFGRGLTYCLGLFIAHECKNRHLHEQYPLLISTWFNGASDHLYELDVDNAPPKLKKRIKKFRDEVLDLGHGSGMLSDEITEGDIDRYIKEAKEILRLIDES